MFFCPYVFNNTSTFFSPPPGGGGGHQIVCDFDLVPTSWLIGHRMSHVRHAKYEDATYCVTREVLENV